MAAITSINIWNECLRYTNNVSLKLATACYAYATSNLETRAAVGKAGNFVGG
jgi:formate-dependent phosphoribosylglycinamide formyltransferase (GAR transformylase)